MLEQSPLDFQLIQPAKTQNSSLKIAFKVQTLFNEKGIKKAVITTQLTITIGVNP